jgi:hypothetical protein
VPPAASDAKPAESAKPPDAKPAPAAAPVLDLKLPADAKVDPAALATFKGIMTDEKLSPAEKAQKVIDLQFAQQAAQEKAWEEQHKPALRTADMEALKADKEFGGAKFEKTGNDARSIMKQFDRDGEMSKLLAEVGRDNAPAFVKFCARIRSVIAEDAVVRDSAPAADDSRLATLKKMFPNSPSMWTMGPQ